MVIAATGQNAELLQCKEADNTATILGACGSQAAVGAAGALLRNTFWICRTGEETSLDCRGGCSQLNE